MKVVEGSFGKTESDDMLMSDMLIEGLEQAGWDKAKGGRFFLIMDNDDDMTFVTNEMQPAEVVMLLQIVNQAIVGVQ